MPRARVAVLRATPKKTSQTAESSGGMVPKAIPVLFWRATAESKPDAVVTTRRTAIDKSSKMPHAPKRERPLAALLALPRLQTGVLTDGPLAVIATAAPSVGPPPPERPRQTAIKGLLTRKKPTIRCLKLIIPRDASTTAYEGARVTKITLPAILERIQIVPRPAIIPPVATRPTVPLEPAAGSRITLLAVLTNGTASTSSAKAKARPRKP